MTGPALEPSAPSPLKSLLSSRWVPPLVLFALLMACYTLDGGFLPTRDAVPNLCLPAQVLKRRALSFSPREAPFMFVWSFRDATRIVNIDVDSWDAPIAGRTADELYSAGLLGDPRPRYYLTPSTREGRFIGIYGPGAGLSAVPYFAFLALVHRGWCENLSVLGQEAKVFSSACVAGAAVLVYLTLLIFLPRRTAFAGGALFGLGTCVWAEPTQALWQQTPVILFVAGGLYFLARSAARPSMTALAGLFGGVSVLCRPTLILLLGASAGYLFWKDRRQSLRFLAAAVVPLILLAGYNAYYLGSPFRMGQAEAAKKLSTSLTGTDDVWQTPLLEGAGGLLISPSRGLFVFSPFLLFAVWGIVELWRCPGFELLRAWSLAAAGLLLIASKWFEWFGGWVFGYRLIVELTPLFMLFLVPVAPRILSSRPLLACFSALAALSVGIQALGAIAYDPVAWHGRQGFEIRLSGETGTRVLLEEEEAVKLIESGRAAPVRALPMDVAQPRFRSRLWSLSDSQLAWLLRPGAAEGCRASRNRLIDGARHEKMWFSGP